ncbi:hypothetical protein Moror_11143 [Moniliophthora roreri MCA 2997]|uniref:Uncharacterized protein n=2 Tax=Moniliophthora roreri TaxID=221103 RepID=V2WM12_MONRO|nr:hypothetical protein Moror_11143 [Moniliophthora roreri MCA 2997]KAI3607396.1 hypothetical protein WG66_004555 [Moniliophthora roreri]
MTKPPEAEDGPATFSEEERELAQCKEELLVLHRIIASTELKRAALETRVRRGRFAKSAVSRIPVEIWREIFMIICTMNYSFSMDTAAPNDIYVALYAYDLSHVCSLWRDIAHATPKLWSSFSVNYHNLQPDISYPLHIYLTNSKDSPLSIQISFQRSYRAKPDGPPFWLTHSGRNTFETLLEHASRWEMLDLVIEDKSEPFLRHFSPEAFSLPLLRKFVDNCPFSAHNAEDEDTVRWFWDAIRTAPLIHDVILDASSNMDVDSYPYHQLMSMEIRHIERNQHILHILPSCTRLQSLKIGVIVYYLGRQPSIPVTLNSLKTLEIGLIYPPKQIEDLLNSLTFPSLTSLELKCWHHEDIPWDSPIDAGVVSLPASLVSMFRRCSSLERMTLEFPYTSLSDGFSIPDILLACPNLRSLHVSLRGLKPSPLTSATLDTFIKLTVPAASSAGPVLAPKLNTLSIHEGTLDFGPNDYEKMTEMLESRASPCDDRHVPLTFLQVTYGDRTSPSLTDAEHKERVERGPSLAAFRDRLLKLKNVRTVMVYPLEQYYMLH